MMLSWLCDNLIRVQLYLFNISEKSYHVVLILAET